MVEALEKLVLDQPATGQTIDIYTNGLIEMYSGMGGNPNAPPAWAMNPMQQKPLDQGSGYGPSGLNGFDTPGGFQTTLPQYTQPPIEPIRPINPNLAGGVDINFDKSTPNTTILKEPLSDHLNNTYIHHDRGPGRLFTDY